MPSSFASPSPRTSFNRRVVRPIATTLALSGLITLGAATNANAAVVYTSTPGTASSEPGTSLFGNFDGVTTNGFATVGTLIGTLNTGSNPAAGGNWASLHGGHSLEVTFAGLTDYFGFVWDTPDSYNFVDFYNGTTLLTTFSGSGIADSFANFTASTSADQFDRVVMRSDGGAFEFDNLYARDSGSSGVPIPATAALLLAGIGVLRLRRRFSSHI